MTSLLPLDRVAPLARAVTEINVLSRAVVFAQSGLAICACVVSLAKRNRRVSGVE